MHVLFPVASKSASSSDSSSAESDTSKPYQKSRGHHRRQYSEEEVESKRERNRLKNPSGRHPKEQIKRIQVREDEIFNFRDDLFSISTYAKSFAKLTFLTLLIRTFTCAY